MPGGLANGVSALSVHIPLVCSSKRKLTFAPFALSSFLLSRMQMQWQELKQPPEIQRWKPRAEEGRAGCMTEPIYSISSPLPQGLALRRAGAQGRPVSIRPGLLLQVRRTKHSTFTAGEQLGHEPGATKVVLSTSLEDLPKSPTKR